MNSKIIMVDFFDTVMFRKVHSSIFLKKWAKILEEKYKVDSKLVSLEKLRNEIIGDQDECEINYKELIQNIYNKISSFLNCDFNDFYEFSLETEMYLDQFTQFPNKKILEFLKKNKSIGKKIFLVTDYFLPGEAYKIYLEYFGLDDLFDEIYVSSDYVMTKKSGKLYKKIMEINHLKANDLFMIGDSKLSDYLKPRELGINSKHYFPLLHKLETNCTKIFCKNYEKKLLKFSYRKCRKYTTFSEYYLNILYFTRKLGEYVKNTSDNICFLSRGGYFLKKCYDFSRKLEDLPKSQYLKISRKVVKNSKEENAKKNLLRSYLDGFIKNGKLTIVDEGWYCHTQIDLCNLYDLDIKGYYIGVCENDNISGHICERKGILFEIDEAHKKSSFYGIFRSNLTFYEQILTSDEGSVIDYEKHDNLIIPIDKINIIENNLYNNYTKNLQKQIFENLKGAYFWKLKPTKEFVAKKMIWTLMAFSRKKNQFLSNYKNSFVNNVNQSTNSFKEKIKVKLDILFFSTHYMRYICKLKESNNLFIKMLYIIFLPLLLIHIYFSYFFERVATKVK